MAIYGSQLNQGKCPQEALDAVKTVLEKTLVQPGSARDALAAFTQGEGDVLLGYENEAIKAQDEGEEVDYVIPPSTILIQTPIAVTKDAPAAAQGFLDFIWSDAGQRALGRERLPADQPEAGRREAVPDPGRPCSRSPSSAAGTRVNDEFFDEATGSVAAIEKELGVSTSG